MSSTSNEMNSGSRDANRTLQGIVVSNRMDKTAVVEVTRKVKHPIFGKYVKRSTKFHVHDEENQCQIGDLVEISEGRPVSKTKSWRFMSIVRRAE